MSASPDIIGAIDIGGTKVTALVADAGRLLARITAPTCKTGSIRALPEQTIDMLRTVCARAGLELGALQHVGVSSAGPFARIDGRLGLATPNICGARSRAADLPNDWDVIPLEAVLREQFAHVVIENDCVSALAAERAFGAVQNVRDCVYVTWSTGVGFGLCVDGHILHGKHGNAGHTGHLLMSERQDALCGCGNRGDLESLISGRNLGVRFGRPAAEIFAAARSGDPQAHAVAVEAAQWFGRGLYNVAVTLDTEVFVLGGSVWQHHGEWLAPMVLAEISARLPALTEGVKLVSAALGPLVADIGALTLVMPPEWMALWRSSRPWEQCPA